MKMQYVFLDDDGNVKSTLITDGAFIESDKILKVDDCESFIGMKMVDGNLIKLEKTKPDPVDATHMSAGEFRKRIFQLLGIDAV